MDTNRRVVLIGLENPDGSLNGALQVIDVLQGMSVQPAGDVKERNLLRSTLSDAGAAIGAKNWDITLPVELKGGGIDGGIVQQPEMHAALLACGMVLEAAKMITVNTLVGTFTRGEVISNTTTPEAVGTLAHVVANGGGSHTLWVRDLDNAPAVADALEGDDSGATATVTAVADALCYRMATDRALYNPCQIHTHMDGIRRIGKRCLGTFKFDWVAGEYCTLQFTMKAKYETPTDQALPAAVYSDLVPPIGQSAGLTIAGYGDGTIERLGFDIGNDIAPVPDLNSADGRHSFRIRDRKPTGGVDPEVLALADFNPFALWENGTKAAIHATLGTVAGERISIVITAAQFTSIGDKERAGNDAYDLSFRATGSNDDELYLFFH